jgi:hypothetical protein
MDGFGRHGRLGKYGSICWKPLHAFQKVFREQGLRRIVPFKRVWGEFIGKWITKRRITDLPLDLQLKRLKFYSI